MFVEKIKVKILHISVIDEYIVCVFDYKGKNLSVKLRHRYPIIYFGGERRFFSKSLSQLLDELRQSIRKQIELYEYDKSVEKELEKALEGKEIEI
ncbi:hypothetical protein JDFR1000234_42 [uncultured archaeal virus]|uniref:Uncharacterized protein n=1 Tax=uncultured archaeal virus TaxID=1960247 RepID=A0A1S5Y316_9VIRU|nr:hypothetical protein JDFR1000234_42 [uncultured archaeal virus]